MRIEGAQRRSVIISGGGIAGLTTALALQQKGFHAIVLERANTPSSLGAGIQISPNALHILDDLGVAKGLRELATAPDGIDIRSASSGKVLSRFDLGTSFLKRHGLPYLVLHRADLLQTLLNACERSKDVDIRFDMRVKDCAVHSTGVTVSAETQGHVEKIEGIGLLGADGIWSAVRDLFDNAAKPINTGSTAWRALLPMQQVPSEIERQDTQLWLSRDAHVVHYPIRNGAYLNTVCVMPNADNTVSERGWIEDVEDTPPFAIPSHWSKPLQALLSTRLKWGGWPLYAAPKVEQLSQGPIALVGDAAHSMVPFAAQGGACAIEDAAVLANACANHRENFNAALSSYSKARTARVNRICQLAKTNGRIYHMSPPLSLARDFVMSRMPQERLQKRMDWLYGWRATTD